jgi:iron(III) transport system permease protein
MLGFRWLRAGARGILGILAILPALALLLAAAWDRTGAGAIRLSMLAAALTVLDPFVWTCVGNSVVFAVVVTAASLGVGVGLGWAVGRRGFWGLSVLSAGVAAWTTAAPVCLALGLVGLWGTPQPWPWPIAGGDSRAGGAGLESWRGAPLWVLWIWSTLPGAVAMVMQATAAAVERLEPAWADAALLAGAGRFRSWRRLAWPLVRPGVARAAAALFPLALLEPGAPLILGLRRSLAFQIVETAGRPDPFPRVAVWCVLAGLIALAGRSLLLWWGGPAILAEPAAGVAGRPARWPPRRATAIPALVCMMALTGWILLAGAPILGLVHLLRGSGSAPGAALPIGSGAGSVPTLWQRVLVPPMPRIALNSLVLGLEAAAGILAVAWLVQPAAGLRWARRTGSGLIGSLAALPPLMQGVGILALPWLAGLAADSLPAVPGCAAGAAALGHLAIELHPDRDPWPLLVLAVGLAVGLRLVRAWQAAAGPNPRQVHAEFQAARLASGSLSRARAAGRPWRPARWIGRFSLAACLAATSLTPALLFAPGSDARTAAPAILALADGPEDARLQASALALGAIAVPLGALALARLASAWPRDGEPGPV